MEILNDTPYAIQPIVFKVQPRQPVMAILAKGLFVLQKDGPCWAAPKDFQQPPLGSVNHEDDFGNSLRIDAETAPHKVRADCLFLGSGHAPHGRPVEALAVKFAVGEMSKTLWLYGDRYWVPQPDGSVHVEGPEPFVKMPIRNEFACGGLRSAYNKHGTGLFDPERPEELKSPVRLANVQDADTTHVDPRHDCTPAGFGPLDPDFLPRAALKGTYDEAWLYRRKPLPPVDFSFDFYNSARRDQQVEGYLRGDEPLYFENLHPEHRIFESRLPGIRLRYFLIKVGADGKPSLLEARNNLDTCMVDMEEESVTLIWRGRVAVDPSGREQYTHLYVGQEELDAPRDTAHYKARIRALLAGTLGAPPPEPAMPEDRTEEIEKAQAEDNENILKDVAEMLEKAKAPPEMLEIAKQQTDPIKAAEALVKHALEMVDKLPKPPGS